MFSLVLDGFFGCFFDHPYDLTNHPGVAFLLASMSWEFVQNLISLILFICGQSNMTLPVDSLKAFIFNINVNTMIPKPASSCLFPFKWPNVSF